MAASSFSRAKVFISYSHKDTKHLKRLQVHLADYERNKLIQIWDDTKITPGATWRDEIKEAIDSANVAILLVSADYLASEFVAESELPRLLTAANTEGIIILPIILSPCGFEYTKLSQFHAVNRLSMPLTKMNYHQREDLWARVAKIVRNTTSTQKSERLTSNDQQPLPDLQTLTQKVLQADTGETALWLDEADVQVPLSAATYKRVLDTQFPGYFIFLVDQSASMTKPFGIPQIMEGRRKCNLAAHVLNDFLNELIITNMNLLPDGTSEVRPCADITILGYSGEVVYSILSGALAGKVSVSLPDLQMNPIDIVMRRRREIDDTGMEIEVEVPIPLWVRPQAGDDDAPMCAAFQRAQELAEQWVANHPNNHPPIVINITGGIASDGDPTKPALRLSRVSTTDGQTLLYNVHISELNVPPIFYPTSLAELPDDTLTRRLFSLSSIIPENCRNLLRALIGREMPSGIRGFILNGDIRSFRLMFQFHEGKSFNPIVDRVERFNLGTDRLSLDEAMLYSLQSLKIQDFDLRQGIVETFSIKTTTGEIKKPWGIQGGFAVVYKFRTQSGQIKALRCFTTSMKPDIQYRYEKMGKYFRMHVPDITINFQYYEDGILVRERGKERIKTVFPVIVMDWIKGVTMLDKVDELCRNPDRAGLVDLHKKWVALVQVMHQARIAHGSLSGTDIMVRSDGSLVLVDYDGVYIPDFAGLSQVVLGLADYEHPQVMQRKFNEQMDNFSILVIQTALLALQTQPELWDQYFHRNSQGISDTNLLFTRQDFLAPDQSNLIATLERISDSRVGIAVQALKQACRQDIDRVNFQLIQ